VKGKLEMITAMLIFGSIGVFVRNIDLPSLEIAFLRATIGGLFLICTGFLIKHKISIKAIRGNALLLILSGIALGLNWVCLFQAYKYSTISLATISYYFAPVFIMMLSPTVLKERLTKRKVACIVIAMLGLLLILNMGDTSLNTSYNHVKGITYGLLGAALYAGVVLMNKFIKDLSGFDTSMIQLNISALVLLLTILYQGNYNFAGIGLKSIFLILLLGILHTGIAYFLYFTAVKQLKGQTIAILSYIDPISALVFSYAFLQETMTFTQIMGGVFILGAAFFSELT
jgi:drug/metabolite transporter (DMT)-like permease